jgi:hypothetical protein
MKRRRDDFYFDDLGYPSSLSICPVCGSSVSKENIDLHVQQHFTQPQPSTSTITTNCCDLEGKIISKNNLDSHILITARSRG